jgi:hypothetical protein
MQRHAGRYMTHPSLAQNLKPPLLEAFWGRGDAGRALRRESLEIIGRKYPSSTKPAEPARPTHKPRKPTLAGVLKQAARAGKSVKGAEVYPDRVVLQFGEPDVAEATINEWDETLSRDKH